MKLRDILIFSIALLLAVGVAYVSRMMLQSDKTGGGGGGQFNTKSVLVATDNMPVGTRMSINKVKWQDWPEQSISPYYITMEDTDPQTKQISEQRVQEMEGSVVRYAIASGEPVKSSSLINPNDKSILSAVISPHKRAFTVTLDRRAHISGHLAPGDFVDVVVALRSSDRKQRGSIGSTVVSNVKVLSVDSDLGGAEKEGGKLPKTVTLEVTPGQAEVLAAALKDGTPAISLRSIASVDDAGDIATPVEKETRAVVLMRGSEDITTINVKQ